MPSLPPHPMVVVSKRSVTENAVVEERVALSPVVTAPAVRKMGLEEVAAASGYHLHREHHQRGDEALGAEVVQLVVVVWVVEVVALAVEVAAFCPRGSNRMHLPLCNFLLSR